MTDANSQPVLCLISDRESYWQSVQVASSRPFIFDATWDPKIIEVANPALVLGMGTESYALSQCFDTAHRLRIPTLVTKDGIAEWRDIWENPKYGAGGNLLNRQLIQVDKIACHGKQQVRLFDGWGMSGRTELVGMPKFDDYLSMPNQEQSQANSPKRLLVMTANTPGHTNYQT